jgi:hypothetical protein
VNKLKTLKGAVLVAATSMLPLSQVAMAEVNISGWVNEGVMFYDDGNSSDVVQSSDNGTTLNSRISFTGSSELPDTSLSAGFEITFEPSSGLNPGLFGGQTPLGLSNQNTFSDDNNFGSSVTVLASNLWMSGNWGKLTFGTQSMPTDNIAVLEDPSVTLWSNVSPVFRGNGFTIQGLTGGAAGTNWGSFLNCFGVPALQIGIDCNGIYRNGVRYDLPAFGPVTIAIGYANDDVYDVAAKYKGDLGSMKASLALGYSVNNGPILPIGLFAASGGVLAPGAAALDVTAVNSGIDNVETFQLSAGLMHPATGLFGVISYQHEEADIVGVKGNQSDETDAYYIKGGIKKQWFGIGDTSIHGVYGDYSDQYGAAQAALGVNGSDIERYSFGVTQYFGAGFQIYGTYENLSLDVDCTAASINCGGVYNNDDDLDMFNLGAVYFF